MSEPNRAESRSDQSDEAAAVAEGFAELHLTDRSRYTLGAGRCLRARYESYHRDGTGVELEALSVPLATGKHLHQAIGNMLELTRRQNRVPTQDEARVQIVAARDSYLKICSERQLGDLSPSVEDLVQEQAALIEAFGWAYWRVILPWLQENYIIHLVEHEAEYVAGCSCGLADGVGTPEDHQRRRCSGVIHATTPDHVLEQRSQRGLISGWELKSVGNAGMNWQKQWEKNVQQAIQSVGIEKLLGGAQVTQYYVLGLIKGERAADKRYGEDYEEMSDEQRATLPKRQQSPLIYGWCRPGSPPQTSDHWAYSYWYYDDIPSKYSRNKEPGPKGFRHSLTKDYERRAIWKARFSEKPETWSAIEFWIMWMPEEVLGKQFILCGPYQRQEKLIGDYLRGMVKQEQRIAEGLERLADYPQDKHPEFHQAMLDEFFPQSWECFRYGDHCSHVRTCFGESGTVDSRMVRRVPHHRRELERFRRKGLLK